MTIRTVNNTDRCWRTTVLSQDLTGTVVTFWQKSEPSEQTEDRVAMINVFDTMIAFGVAAGQLIAHLPAENHADYLRVIQRAIKDAVKQGFKPERYTQ